jgi:cell division protein FtsQ
MDGRGRHAQSLRRWTQRPTDAGGRADEPRRRRAPSRPPAEAGLFSRLRFTVGRFIAPLWTVQVPRFAGLTGVAVVILGAGAYGAVKGEHVPAIVAAMKDASDHAANRMGFRIAGVSLSGQRQVSREQIFAAAGVTAHSSLLLLDVTEARKALEANPWISEATVRKLYPDRLAITIKEREAFALHQVDGKVSVIATDGTLLANTVTPRFATLPFIVGRGAETKAKDYLAVLDRHPAIRDQVRASILVADRRWNLRLKNGIDVRLPDGDLDAAFALLTTLDRERKLLTRDIVAVDLRLPDRVGVRLSEAAAAARDEKDKDKKPKKKGDA